MNIVLSYIITLLLFIGTTVLSYVGWPVDGDVAVTKYYYPSFYLLFIYYILNIGLKNLYFKHNNKYTTFILITIVVAFIFGRLIKGGGQIDLLINNIAIPTLYAVFFMQKKSIAHVKIKKLILTMFYLNSLLAIYERITLQNFFPLSLTYSYIDFSISSDFDANIFRSTALMGHPLTNALLTSIIMIFILVSDSIKPKYKIIHYGIGFISLFCFNARGAILLSVFFASMYILRILSLKRTKLRIKISIITILFLAFQFIIILISAGFGGRFFEHEVTSDRSILARFEVWNLFQNINIELFLAGVPDIGNFSMRILGYNHIENWFILMSLQVGILFTIIFIYQFYKLSALYLQPYSKFNRLILIGLTLGVSSTNNSLACGVPAIALFFVCCYAFKPQLNISKN